MEIGVLSGHSLAIIARHPGTTYGVDSFEGMAEPSKYDIVDGVNNYPKGRLSVPMSRVSSYLAAQGVKASLVKGFVPEILGSLPQGPFAFVHLDIDHYEPTLAALDWLFPRMLPGGILLCDDWFENQDFLAARAINEVATSRPLTGTRGRKAWWVI